MATKLKKYVIRPVRNFVIYLLIKSLFSLSILVIRKPLVLWHKFLGQYIYYCCKSTRQIILHNLKLVFKNESYAGEFDKIGERLYSNLGITFTDYVRWSWHKSPKFFLKHFNIEGENNLRAAYTKGKGVLCLVTHTPGWEFSAFMPAMLGYKLHGVSARINNPAINKMMIHMREVHGMHNITRDHCYDQLCEVLRKGDCLIIMTDQDSLKIKGAFVDFLGINAYTPIGCSRMQMETGAAVVPMYTVLNPDLTYSFIIEPEIDPIYTPDGKYDIVANTLAQNNRISATIRKYPDQWVWMHKRFSTTPEMLDEYLKMRGIK